MPENPSSPKIENYMVQQLISKTAKSMNFNYRSKVAKRKADNWAIRQDKVWARLRKEYSVDRFKQARRAYWQGNQFQQRYFIEQMEKAFDGR